MTLRHTINLGNSIIGVSILAMPFCFAKCGIILGIVSILMSGLLNRAGCHLILKSAMMSKRRNFELLAYQTFGSAGKLMAEFGVLGFLLGSCVAFFVVIGDLAPSLVSELLSVPNGPHLRAFLLTFLGMFVALPLGLLRRVESLTSFSALSLGLYVFLVLKMLSEASSSLMSTSAKLFGDKVNLWQSSGLLTTLPIFGMALACQPQLFEIFDGSVILSDDYNSIKKMNAVIKDAVNLSSLVYISVGVFGYCAFVDEPIRGNILVFLSPSLTSTFAKIGFIFTVIISLPLCLFPCRTSLHSMFFRKGTGSLLNEMSHTQTLYMSDRHFTLLTIVLIVFTIGISVLLPHIEVILGIIGSTIGTMICFILPAAIYLSLTSHNTTERLMANFVLYVGIFMLVACSYSTIQEAKTANEISTPLDALKALKSSPEGNLQPKLPLKPIASSSSEKPVVKLVPEAPPVVAAKQPVDRKEKDVELGKELLKKLNKDREEQMKLMKENAALQKQILKEIQHLDAEHHQPVDVHKQPQNSKLAPVEKHDQKELKEKPSKDQVRIKEKNVLKAEKPAVKSASNQKVSVLPVHKSPEKAGVVQLQQAAAVEPPSPPVKPVSDVKAAKPTIPQRVANKVSVRTQVQKPNSSIPKETSGSVAKGNVMLPKRDTLGVGSAMTNHTET